MAASSRTRLEPYGGVVAGQAAMIGGDQVAALGLGDELPIGLEQIREDHARALLIEPLEFLAAEHEDAAQHHLGDTLGMGLGIGERQRRAPGSAVDLPALDAEMLAQALDVGDEIPGGVLGDHGMRGRAAAAALIEEHDAIGFRVVQSAHRRGDAAAGAAVQADDRLALRIAAHLPVDLVQVGDLQSARRMGFDFGEEGVAHDPEVSSSDGSERGEPYRDRRRGEETPTRVRPSSGRWHALRKPLPRHRNIRNFT